MGVLNWSLTAARNALVDPMVRALDGASARDLPGMVRGVMSGVRALSDDRGGALVSSGTGNSYVVQTLSGVTELRPGLTVGFWADRDNTDAPTLNVDGTGPKSLRAPDGSLLDGGAIQLGCFYLATWDEVLGSLPKWRLVGSGAAGGAAGTLLKPDASGTIGTRAIYNSCPPGFVYLAVSTTSAGPAWTLYVKQGTQGTDADWSAGLPVKMSPAQSTADAQAAANTAAAAQAVASDRAAVATGQAATAADRATVAVAQAATATAQAGLAVDRAAVATAQATLATQNAATSTAQAGIATGAATVATASRDTAVGAANSATAAATATAADRTQTQLDRAAAAAAITTAQTSAGGAAASAADARSYAGQLATAVYDWSYDSNPDPSNDWSVG